MASSDQINDLTALYVGYFDRAPDPLGLNFWIDQIDNGREFNTIAADFAASPEAEALYPFLTTPSFSSPSDFIKQIYANLFNRNPDGGGLTFWTGQLVDGNVSVADMIEAIILGARDDAGAGTFDKATLDNKVAVGLDFATKVNQPGFVYDAAAAVAAVAVLDGVTNDTATADAAKLSTDVFVTTGVMPGTPGETFTLDSAIMGEIADGTPAMDTFNVITGSNATLNTFDQIDGKGSIDTLNLITDAPTGGLPTASQMKNVEIIDAEVTAAVTTLDSSGLVDVTNLNIQGVLTGLSGVTLGESQSVEFGAGAARPAGVTVTVDAAETDTTITLAGADDATNITLAGAANTTLTVNGSVAGTGTLALTAAATTETINLGLTSDSVIAFGGGASVTTVDASTSTGDLTIDATGGSLETLKGGSGDDTLTASGTAGEVIIGGAGKDLIDLTVNANSQTVEFNAGDTGLTTATIDTVANFNAAHDLIDFNLTAGSAANFFDGGNSSSYTSALSNANTAFGSGLQYFASDVLGDTYVFVDADLNGTADMAVELTGLIGGLTDANFIA